MLVDSNSAIAQIRSVSGISRSKHYLVPLRKIQEICHVGAMHVQRIDSKDIPAHAYTKPLPPGSFWRHSTAAAGGRLQTHQNVELRDRIMATEYHGGSVEAVVRDLGKTKSAKQKAAKKSRKSRNERKTDTGEASTIDDAIRGSD